MDFIAKKYTILMNNEPIDIWLKNGKVKKAYFMDKRIELNFSKDLIAKIKDHPTRVVNGANFTKNREFTNVISKMMSQKLEFAIAKHDKKTLSRFARSDLVPENMQDNFLKAINRQQGIRGMLVRAVNRTNNMLQNLAKSIDRFFDKVNDKIANQKLDEYLSIYQNRELNRVNYFDLTPPKTGQKIDSNLLASAELFIEAQKDKWQEKDKENPLDKTYSKDALQKFLRQSVEKGYTIREATVAFSKAKETIYNAEQTLDMAKEGLTERWKLTKQIDKIKENLLFYQKKEASKNVTIEDFKTLASGMNGMQRIDILLENKEYQQMDNAQKEKIENKFIFTQEPLNVRAVETLKIAQELKQEPQKEFKTVLERNATVDFTDKTVKNEISSKWSELQKINREQQAQNRDFMNISAVRFDGVSQKSLDKWSEEAVKRGVDEKIVSKFKDATIRNAKELEKVGIFKEVAAGEYKFKDTFAKEVLYKNLDKPVAKLDSINRGVEKTIEVDLKQDLTQRVQNISSEKSFESLKNERGEIDPDKLLEYSKKLESIGLALKESANQKSVTREDLQRAERGYLQEQNQGAQRERA